MKPKSLFYSYTKINSRWIQDRSLRCETIRLLEENIGKILQDIDLDFLNNIPEAQIRKAKIITWEYIKLKASTQKRKHSTK